MRGGPGALVDCVGTALTWARRGAYPVPVGLAEALVGWLVAHRDPASGLWGSSGDRLLEPVNGTCRAVRGTLASRGPGVGGEDPLIDTVLRRVAAITGAGVTACDALDVVHPLCGAELTRPDYRHGEIVEVAGMVLSATFDRWVPGHGLLFNAGREPPLQGTEMRLAVAWHAADLLGQADALGCHPRGVHRPEPMLSLRHDVSEPVVS